jgi:hypothetical protein
MTVVAPIMSLSGEVHAALAGTHSPRNSAATLPPVMVWDVGKAETAIAKDEVANRLKARALTHLMELNMVVRFSFIA